MTIIRSAEVFVNNLKAGILNETDEGYSFKYLDNYNGEAVSLTLPVQKEEYQSKNLFPFFDGLIPEGWLLEVVIKNWKLDPRDRFSLLLRSANDPIGNVTVRGI